MMTVTSNHLELRTASHDKFYRVTQVGDVVLTRWGRRGTRGQARTLTGVSAETVRWSKVDRGYGTVCSATHEAPPPSVSDRNGSKSPDPTWVAAVDSSFIAAVFDHIRPRVDRGGDRAVVAIADHVGLALTPGLGDVIDLLRAGPHATAGDLLLAEVSAGQAVDLRSIASLAVRAVDATCADPVALATAAGLLVPAEFDEADLAAALDSASLLCTHTS